MSDKYAVLRRDLPELVAEAKRQGGINPRAQLIIDLLAERDELAANTAPQPQQDVARLIICDECHDKCADPYTGLFASHCPDEEPCIMCECSSLRRQLAEQQPAPDVAGLVAKMEILIAAGNRLNANAEECNYDDGTAEVAGSEYWCEFRDALDAARAAIAAPQPAEQQPALARYQPCGCVICTCEHETQCQGCGAKHCGTHPVGQIPGPVYQQPAPDVAGLWADHVVGADKMVAAVQGEPVARVKTVGGYPDESEHVAEWLCKHKDLKDGDYLYLVQQPAEQQPSLLDDGSLAYQIGEIGNQIHNLGCEHQNDEELADRLAEIAHLLWKLQQSATISKQQPVPDVSGLVEALVACTRASSAAEVGLIVDAALAAHRKQGGAGNE